MSTPGASASSWLNRARSVRRRRIDHRARPSSEPLLQRREHRQRRLAHPHRQHQRIVLGQSLGQWRRGIDEMHQQLQPLPLEQAVERRIRRQRPRQRQQQKARRRPLRPGQGIGTSARERLALGRERRRRLPQAQERRGEVHPRRGRVLPPGAIEPLPGERRQIAVPQARTQERSQAEIA
jgi:hypothetical protein